MPNLKNKILFLEDDNIMGNYFAAEFERNLQSLIQILKFNGVKGILFGRFDDSCKIDINVIQRIVSTKNNLKIYLLYLMLILDTYSPLQHFQ